MKLTVMHFSGCLIYFLSTLFQNVTNRKGVYRSQLEPTATLNSYLLWLVHQTVLT